jgi:exodeoxyribonuclease VII large subunit
MSTRLPFDDERPRGTAGRAHSVSPPAAAGPAAGVPSAARRVLSVSELSARIRSELESTFADVWVEGEISGSRVWNTGHCYFTLKDARSQIKGVIFRSALRLLKFKIEDGLQVIARGRVSVYDPKGEYQIVCEHMEPRGLGALQLAFEQLKRRLAAEGLFDAGRKRPLPTLPRCIGIVTSVDGAVLRDMVRVLRRRHPNAHLVIAPTRVQGQGAAGEIARALAQIARVDGVDVVIVGRGGGSLEDLWAFNEEAVARAIAASPVPVISAVGHETDVTIADFVADVRAPTPSAAAEIVVKGHDEFKNRIDRLGERLTAAVYGRLHRIQHRLQQLQTRPGLAGYPARVAGQGRHVADATTGLNTAMRTVIRHRARRLDGMRRGLERINPRQRVAEIRTLLVSCDADLKAAVVSRLHRSRSRFQTGAARLEGLSPLAVLGRGYAVCWDRSRSLIVRDAGTLTAGDHIHVTLQRGEVRARVTGTG